MDEPELNIDEKAQRQYELVEALVGRMQRISAKSTERLQGCRDDRDCWTEKCSHSAPPATAAAHCSPSRQKSAFATDGDTTAGGAPTAAPAAAPTATSVYRKANIGRNPHRCTRNKNSIDVLAFGNVGNTSLQALTVYSGNSRVMWFVETAKNWHVKTGVFDRFLHHVIEMLCIGRKHGNAFSSQGMKGMKGGKSRIGCFCFRLGSI
mgnify:CR=1 FL=1